MTGTLVRRMPRTDNYTQLIARVANVERELAERTIVSATGDGGPAAAADDGPTAIDVRAPPLGLESELHAIHAAIEAMRASMPAVNAAASPGLPAIWRRVIATMTAVFSVGVVAVVIGGLAGATMIVGGVLSASLVLVVDWRLRE